MSCAKVQERLDALVDGELAAAERRRIEEHLGSCLPCHRELRRRRELLALARDLPPLEPLRDLWPEVAARIDGHRRRRLPPWLPLAAAAALLLALAAPVLLWRDATAPEMASTPVAAVDADLRHAEAARSHDGTLQLRHDLRRELERQRALLPAGALDGVERDLAILDLSVAQLAAALEEDPLNRHLSSQLAARYQREVEILQRISRI